jgi:hypothetical protein
MTPGKWSLPATEPLQGQAGGSSDASKPSRPRQWGAMEYVVQFVLYLIFFGLVGSLFASRVPIAIGAFLFFTDDGLTEWLLQKIGIRLVRDSFGSEFIKAFVFVTVAWASLAYCKESVPTWLSPPADVSWAFIGVTALVCAVLSVVSVAIIGKLLPRVGIVITPGSSRWTIATGLIGLGILTVLAFLAATPMVSDWLAIH